MSELDKAVTAQRELSELELARVIGGSSKFPIHDPGPPTLQRKLVSAMQRLLRLGA
jgi:hypothetical protein